MTRSKAVRKYLSSWSSWKEPLDIAKIKIPYNNVLIIPLFRELDNINGQIKNIKKVSNQRTLLIYIVNQTTDNQLHLKENKKTIDEIHALGPTHPLSNTSNITEIENLSVVTIDRISPPLPANEGVGLARKIGADLACLLFENGLIENEFFYSSDGDAIFPKDYFQEPLNKIKKSTFLLKNFVHTTDLLEDKFEIEAMKAYEFYLKYYPESLRNAGSTYGFHTVGSCFMIHFESYAKVRGYPKKSAGEDFYIANKLSKIGPLSYSKLDPISLQGRTSDRVPFGTGPSIKTISDDLRKGIPYLIPSPKAFESLGLVIDYARSIIKDKKENQIPEKILKIAETLGVIAHIERSIKSSNETAVQLKSFTDWFDGLRQLQFINEISKSLCPKVSYTELQKTHYFDR